MWQYSGASSWRTYEQRVSDALERAYRSGEPQVQIIIGAAGYTVTFKSRQQSLDVYPTKSRRVRRLEPYDAGRIRGGIPPAAWQHMDGVGGRPWHEFPAAILAAVDAAFRTGKPGTWFSLEGREYAVNFRDMVQNATDTGKIRMIQRLGALTIPASPPLPNGAPVGHDKVPMDWSPVPAPYHEVELLGVAGFELECSAVQKYFAKTTPNTVTSIKRIQNAALWDAYAERRKAVAASSANKGEPNEDFFWHGTKALDAIKTGGFDVRFGKSGSSVGTAVIWVSTNSKYSSTYGSPMFLVRATLGNIGTDSHHERGTSTGHVRKDDQVGGGSEQRYLIPHNYQLYPAYIVHWS